NITFNMAPYAGQTVRIKFLVHGDNAGDPTSMFVDDLSFTLPCDANNVDNPGFETGSFAPWVVDSSNPAPAVSTAQAHSGIYSALIGSTSGETPGDSSFYQTIDVPPGGGTLSYWYRPSTVDSISFD